MVKWMGNILLALLSLPLAIGIVDAWWKTMFNTTLIIHWWDVNTFTAALLLTLCGLIAKIATLWMEA